MAMQICEICGRSFRHDFRGRPPKACPEHRGIKSPPKVKIEEGSKAIDALPTEDGSIDLSGYRSNQYEGKCYVCHNQVDEGQGYLHRVNPDERSKAFHGDCLRGYLSHGDKTQEGTQGGSEGSGNIIKQVATEDAAKMLEAFLATLRPTLDEEEIRRIIQDQIGDQLSEERIKALVRAAGVVRHEITINNEPVVIEGMHHCLLPSFVKRIGAGVPGKRLNVFLPGPAGSGKSTMAEQAAKLLDLNFGSMSMGPTTPTSKLFGYMNANGNFIETEFYRIFKDGGIFLIDELDNGHPGLTAELNQALANSTAAFACGMVAKHPEFRCVATGNTYGRGPDRLFVGRNILDAATLDRFVIMFVDIDENMETQAAMSYATDDSAETVTKWIAHVRSVRAKVMDAKMQVVVSPRASIDGAMMLTAGIPWPEVVNERLVPGMAADIRLQVGA